jgi:hypothetical protein
MFTHRVVTFALLLWAKNICVAGHPNEVTSQRSLSASNATAFAVTVSILYPKHPV